MERAIACVVTSAPTRSSAGVRRHCGCRRSPPRPVGSAQERSGVSGGDVQARTGISLDVITPRVRRRRLSVAGCSNLIDPEAEGALVLDVGGGSTELAWLDLRGRRDPGRVPPIAAWLSVPIGVVTLAERFPEGDEADEAWFRAMVEAIKAPWIAAFANAFESGCAICSPPAAPT